MLGTTATAGPFPLLFKFLDAHKVLSVQVHPDDAAAARRTPPDRGKTEAWYVVEAEPNSCIYAGLKPGVNQHDLAEAITAGTCEGVLHTITPRVGDCIFIPAGTVHAIGAGLVVAEIQQSSDVTFCWSLPPLQRGDCLLLPASLEPQSLPCRPTADGDPRLLRVRVPNKGS
jgi:mannose-6-phosphate isomerase